MGGGMRADWLLEPGLLIRSCGLTGDKVGESCACMMATGGSSSCPTKVEDRLTAGGVGSAGGVAGFCNLILWVESECWCI